ncbi:MAG: hypothetical protein JW993_01815 [Sedimentisphaerales bacterium]|nr:hypothetical protein [Sedimentisphaerales bacterium]
MSKPIKGKCLGVLLVLVCWCVSAGLGAENAFNASVSSSGQLQGGGDGHSGGNWYYYPNSQYYTQWFYNGPFDQTSYKTIDWSVRVELIDIYAYAYVKIAINWTTDRWISTQSPPLPSQFSGDPTSESQIIKHQVVFEGVLTSARTLSGQLEIRDYCPAWISVDVQGQNVRLTQGKIVHECQAQEQYYDYGDAPDPPFPTLAANNGASHTIDNVVYLGTAVDAEADGQPTANATGDDNNNLDDEDGVTFTSTLVPGATATVQVVASTFGVLNAWIDFNGDGDWADAGEKVFPDQPLATGINNLSFTVPAQAKPGQTFSRWRFSSAAGLSFTGPAFNGEVEDHAVRIEPPYVAQDYYKWQQPPVEYDPYAPTPIYCGWDEPSYVVLQGNYTGSYTPRTEWKIVADDFRCYGSMPVTSVHWWGSYVGWNQTSYPTTRPVAYLLGFWSNVPANVDAAFSHPGKLLHTAYIPISQVNETWVGRDQFPNKPNETCFKYHVQLNPQQYFWQERFLDVTNDDVFWLSVLAIYQGTGAPSYPWGWKTRPAHWLDDGVTITLTSSSVGVGAEPSTSTMRPAENSAVCQPGESYDLSFALDTDPQYVKWDQPYTGLRDWPYYEDQISIASLVADGGQGAATKWEQEPDLSGNGVDMDATDDSPRTWLPQILADDFQCTTPGPITQIDVWGSWFSDIITNNDPGSVEFTLNIHKDIPANQSPTGYSTPGAIVWSKTYAPKSFTVTKYDAEIQPFYSPCSYFYIRNNHREVYKYTFQVPDQEAYYQEGTTQQPVVYWLSVQAHLTHKAGTVPTRWGWKTSTREWNDTAVYAQDTDASAPAWKKLDYPSPHSYYGRKVGLSFTITTGAYQDDGKLYVQYQVADDWLCDSAYPISAAAWWGSYKGYYYRPCACQDQPAPQKPYYFWLTLWTDKPDLYPNDPGTYSSPDQLVWEYKAFDYDEVLVGYDWYPGGAGYDSSYEAVYRYTARIPKQYWFYQPGKQQVFWFSVVAVYRDHTTIPYQWGWTNHKHAYNDDAVTSVFPYTIPDSPLFFWTPLYDKTGASADMSFTLYTEPAPVDGDYPVDGGNDGGGGY